MLSKCRFVLLSILLVFGVLPGCSKESSFPLVLPSPSGYLNLTTAWQSNVTLNKSERITRMFILGDAVYVVSNRNYLFCLDRETGKFKFGTSLGQRKFLVFGPQLYQDQLLFVTGNTLQQIDTEFGSVIGSKRLGFTVVAPAARNSSYVYIAGADRRLHSIKVGNKLEAFQVAAANNSMVTSIAASDDFVVFSTEAGNIISILPNSPSRLWQFDVAGDISTPVVRDDNFLFVCGKDTNIYKLNASKGKLQWKQPVGGEPLGAPRVTDRTVYQYARNKGLAAIDKKTGKLIWQLPQGLELLAEAGKKAYVITNRDELVVMDNEKGEELYSVGLAAVSLYAFNQIDSKIYLANQTGRIICIEPVN